MKTKALPLGLVLLSLLFVNQLSYVDGVFIPAAKKKIPDIPVQRALVKYQGGTEALIIESTLDGEGGDYGWIIPVPNQPTKFDKVSPGLLKKPYPYRYSRKSIMWGLIRKYLEFVSKVFLRF